MKKAKSEVIGDPKKTVRTYFCRTQTGFSLGKRRKQLGRAKWEHHGRVIRAKKAYDDPKNVRAVVLTPAEVVLTLTEVG